MSHPDASPPHLKRRTGKRKRVEPTRTGFLTIASSQSDAAAATAPFARSPSERIQLSLAGLSDTDTDPTRGARHFPHGALAAEHHQGWQDDDGDDDQPSNKKPGGAVAVGDCGRYFDVLLRSLHQMLDRGNIVRAEKTYRLLFQLRPASRPVDVCQHNLWATGAEILMRAGEKPPASQDTRGSLVDEAGDQGHVQSSRVPTARDGFSIPARWGSAANINRVKAYFEALIQRYPYDPKSPRRVSAPDFQLAMLGCEIYNVHLEYASGLAQAEKKAHTWQKRRSVEGLDGAAKRRLAEALAHSHGKNEGQEEVRGHAKAEARARALLAMEDITRRMHLLLETPPYPKNNDFLRLRATASLYAADLLAAMSRMTSSERCETEKKRSLQRQAAVDALEKLVHNGGELDRTAQEMLSAWEEEDEDSSTPPPLYSSLPIRKI